jgi:hypothetical protein
MDPRKALLPLPPLPPPFKNVHMRFTFLHLL